MSRNTYLSPFIPKVTMTSHLNIFESISDKSPRLHLPFVNFHFLCLICDGHENGLATRNRILRQISDRALMLNVE